MIIIMILFLYDSYVARVDRFRSGNVNEYSSSGFRIIWTAVWIPQDIPDGSGNIESKQQLHILAVYIYICYSDNIKWFINMFEPNVLRRFSGTSASALRGPHCLQCRAL